MVVLSKNRSPGTLRQACARAKGEIHGFPRRARGYLQGFIGNLVDEEVYFIRISNEGRYHLPLLCILLFAKRVRLSQRQAPTSQPAFRLEAHSKMLLRRCTIHRT